MEYFAFGETFVEEHRSSNNSPYKFNGKELDEETGWYYYGARYYSPRESFWLSVDPLIYDGTFLIGKHNGGVLNNRNLNPYIYCYQNPIRLVDPNGKQTEVIESKKEIGNCEGCQVITLEHGDYMSDVQNQIYEATFNGITKENYENLKTKFTSDPGLINDNFWADYELIDRDGSGGVSIDDHIDIGIWGDSGSVIVQDVAANATGFMAKFATLEGHPDAGNIYFGAFYNEKTQTLTYRINNNTRTNSGMSFLGGPLVSRAAQQRQWKIVLSNVANILSTKPSSASMNISEYDYNDWTNKQGDLEWTRTTDITNFVTDNMND